MADDLKKQMRRFESLIGFKGKLNVVSRKSMKELIEALSSKYKNDVYNSLRLHRLEFFHDLIESQRKKKEKQEKASILKIKLKQKQPRKMAVKEENKPIDEEQQQLKDKIEVELKTSDEETKIRAEDIDDWKDLMTLSRIYYVMEYPRSEGITWKRRITKKKKIDKFEDMDLIEWRVSQNFRLRGLDEWAQRRTNVNLLAKKFGYDIKNINENNVDSKEMEELLYMFDPSDKTSCMKTDFIKKSKKSPFKFSDENMVDWTESYSEDSEHSDVEDFMDESEDLSDESDIEISDFKQKKSLSVCEEEYISELLPVYPEFLRYKEPIFKKMDEAKTFEDWYKLYKEAISQFEEPKSKQAVKFDEKLDTIIEEKEEILSEEIIKIAPIEEERKFSQEFNNAEEKGRIQEAKIQDEEQIVKEPPEIMENMDDQKVEKVINETEKTILRTGKFEEVTEENKEKIEEQETVKEQAPVTESKDGGEEESKEVEKTVPRNGNLDEVAKGEEKKTESQRTEKEYVVDDEEK